MDCDTNNVHRQPSLELRSPKKSKYLTIDLQKLITRMGDFVPGNNRFGSKGTIRCQKCQQRKGKVSLLLNFGG
jgi:hypothetical protein